MPMRYKWTPSNPSSRERLTQPGMSERQWARNSIREQVPARAVRCQICRPDEARSLDVDRSLSATLSYRDRRSSVRRSTRCAYHSGDCGLTQLGYIVNPRSLQEFTSLSAPRNRYAHCKAFRRRVETLRLNERSFAVISVDDGTLLKLIVHLECVPR